MTAGSSIGTLRDRPISIKLSDGAGQRIGDGLVGGMAAATQYLLGGFFAALALVPASFGMHRDLFGRALAGALAVFVQAFGRWGRGRVRGAATGDTRLIVESDALVIRHDGLLDAPAVIPRDALSLVAVDRDAPASAAHSLPVVAESGGRLTWLWERHSGSPVPTLGPPLRAPNVALLFHHPIDFTPRRRWRAARRPGSSEAGLLLRVRDVAALVAALEGWRVIRPVAGADLGRAAELGPPRPPLPYGV